METQPHEYDLADKLAPHLDRHLIFPILMSIQGREVAIYDNDSLARAQIAIVDKTYMLDFQCDVMNNIKMPIPDEVNARKEQVVEAVKSGRERTLKLLKLLEEEESYNKIKKLNNLDDLYDGFELEDGVLDDLFDYARTCYMSGNYAHSGNLLVQYRMLILIGEGDKMQGEQSNERQNYLLKIGETGRDPKKYLNATWGCLASSILQGEWIQAADFACQLDQAISTAYENVETRQVFTLYGKQDQRIETCKNEALQQRTWFVHWILFILFRVEWGNEQKKDGAALNQSWTKLVDIFLNEKSLSVMALGAPHLLRYVAALLILYNKKLKHLMRDILLVIHAEADNYSDPITNFLLALYINMDFDDAQVQLQKCYHVCQVDYFLEEHYKTFLENARLLIFESYCRVHQYIDINMIAEKLNMRPDLAEVWIVNLIQSAKLSARIDSENNRVLMAKENPSVYQQVIDKTKNISFRTTLVQANSANLSKMAEKKTVRYN